MIDTSTPKGKLIEAALRLAETRKWSDVFLAELPDKTMVASLVRSLSPFRSVRIRNQRAHRVPSTRRLAHGSP